MEIEVYKITLVAAATIKLLAFNLILLNEEVLKDPNILHYTNKIKVDGNFL